LYTADNLSAMRGMKWITRVPLSVKEAKNKQKSNKNTRIVRPINFVGVNFLFLPNALSQDLRNVGLILWVVYGNPRSEGVLELPGLGIPIPGCPGT